MRKFLLLFLILAAPTLIFAQAAAQPLDLSNYGVKIDAEKRLIVVLAALEMAHEKNASGQDVKLINTTLSESGKKFREQLLLDNQGLNEDLRSRISVFVSQYKKRHPNVDDAAIVAPFISMAYALSPVPEMYDPVVTGDLPGELLDVLDFAPLAREFYRRSGISSKLDDYVKAYRLESDAVLRPSAHDMVGDLLEYMHTRPEVFYVEKVKVQTQKGNSKSTVLEKVESREHERRFVIVPEMLAPSGTINFLNIKDDYFVVVPPDKDLTFSEARRAFIRFVVDPLILRNSKDLLTIKDSIKPLLDKIRISEPSLSPDVYLAVSRSMVAAIDARQLEYAKAKLATQQARAKIATLKTDEEKRAVTAELERFKRTLSDDTALELSDAYEHGAVMAFYFADQLKGMEDSGFDIAASLREMIAAFDASKEGDRLAQNAEGRKRALAARTERKTRATSIEGSVDNPVTVRLLEIQKTIDAKNFDKAAADLKQLAVQFPAEPRVYYNIGRVASLSAENIEDQDALARKLLEARVAYSNVITTANERLKSDKTLEAQSDKALLSLSYVALARIYEFANNNDYAIQLYDAAIGIGDVTDGAFRSAVAGKQALLKKPQ